MRRVPRMAVMLGGAMVSVIGVCAVLALAGALSARSALAAGEAAAGTSTSAPVAPAAPDASAGDDDSPPSVQWQLDVVRDGQTIDTFKSTTMLGQAFTATHHHPVTHRVGCKENPAGGIDLARTITVSPVAAEVSGVTLAIEADETIEDDAAPATPEGCKLPPQPRRVTASHPGLAVPLGEWAAWTLIDKNPTLVYRVHANVTSH